MSIYKISGARLAPMAGVADRAYRQIMREFGAEMAVTEMISVKAVVYGDKKTFCLADLSSDTRPVAVQLFGSEPVDFSRAAEILLRQGVRPDVFDVNAGCPMPKITKAGAGCALMRDLPRLGKIVKCLNELLQGDIPVSVKIRAGWADNVNAVEAAKVAEDSGVSEITVHGRTGAQLYSGVVDLDVIKAVKAAVRIPVIGNGDVKDVASAARMLEYTKCDGLAAGRGSYGNPWLFRSLKSNCDYVPSLAERVDVMERHVRLLVEYKGEFGGMREARRVAGYYLHGLRGASALRRECAGLAAVSDFDVIVEKLRTL